MWKYSWDLLFLTTFTKKRHECYKIKLIHAWHIITSITSAIVYVHSFSFSKKKIILRNNLYRPWSSLLTIHCVLLRIHWLIIHHSLTLLSQWSSSSFSSSSSSLSLSFSSSSSFSFIVYLCTDIDVKRERRWMIWRGRVWTTIFLEEWRKWRQRLCCVQSINA